MIGRQKEQKRLMEAYNSDSSEFVVVYGRRRVGKTFLVNETFDGKFAFQHTGVTKAKMKQQLVYFRDSLEDAGYEDCPTLKTWHDAFRHLQKHLESLSEGRKVVFIDELPYMATKNSDCVMSLEHFWNGWAARRKDVLLIVCGSAASWLLKKIIANKGGLHNRVTLKILLTPFTLSECEHYAAEKKLGYSRKQICECYMALGGIPFYWKPLEKGLSVAQNMDQLFFARDAVLKHEYDELYTSLFDSPEPYMKIVEALGKNGGGLTRDEISAACGIPSGGVLTKYIADLEDCGFIQRMKNYGKDANGQVIRLIDNYTLFYFKFILNNAGGDESFWSNSAEAQFRKVWSGLAFERVVIQHAGRIKAKLGIAGVRTSVSCWRHKADDVWPKGAQIDMLIDRADDIINVCEMKFCKGRYTIDREEYDAIENRRAAFEKLAANGKGVHVTMITTEGLSANKYADDIQSAATLDDLFAP